MRYLLLMVLLMAGCRSADVSANLLLKPDGERIEIENARITIAWRSDHD